MKGRIVVVCFVWLSILGIGVGVWKFFIIPAKEAAAKQAKEAEQDSYLNPMDEWAVKIQPKLSDEDWKKLIVVNTLQVPPIVFPRGASKITEQSAITLNELIDKLHNWPQYFILIKGNASLQGDVEANKAIASSRADSVLQYLLDHGVGTNKVKVMEVEPTGSTDVVVQLAYKPN